MSSAETAEGSIFQIQRWSLHDGRGIRSTVFMTGCPLRCAWCANPESWAAGGPQIRTLSVKNLLVTLSRDAIFYRESGGGVTFSGGEPLLQEIFLRQALKACRGRGYHTAIETSAEADWDAVADVFEQLDQVFVDLKHMNPALHRQYTGRGNARILANIQKIISFHQDVTVRVPLIAGVNDSLEHIESLAEFISCGRNVRLEFMPCHNLGESKYVQLGIPFPPAFSAPAEERISALKKAAARWVAVV